MKQPFPRLIGLTGSMASGKSTALKELARLGAYTLSADELVRELYQAPSVRQWLMRNFGSAEPKQVAKAVFKSARARQKLEAFLHPRVWKSAQQKLAVCPARWAVLEVPLLFEVSWDKKMDLTVVVTADDKTLAKRLKARGISQATYQARRRTQCSESEKINRADMVIFNNGTKRALCTKVSSLYSALTDLYAN